MALKAGYKGIKDVGDGLQITTDGVLEITGESVVIPNPEGEATESLTKLEVGSTIYGIEADDMCATGEYTLNLVACAVTPSNGQPEFFIPWTNPKKKSITLGSSFKIYRRNNSSWEELTWTTPPTILAYENGFYIGLTLDTPLTAEQIYGFRVQGKIIFS